MKDSVSDESAKRKISSLIITSKGGGGHITFSNKVSEILRSRDGEGSVKTVQYVDLLPRARLLERIRGVFTRGPVEMISWFVGKSKIERGIENFNSAIKEGDSQKIEGLVMDQPLLDGIKNSNVQSSVTKLLEGYGQLKEVHITEVNGILGILRAIERENYSREQLAKKIKEKKELTEKEYQRIQELLGDKLGAECVQIINQGRDLEIQIEPIKVHIHITDVLSYRNGYMEGITQAMLYIDQKYNTEEKGFFKAMFDQIQSIYFKICESVFGYVSDNKCDTPTKVSIEFPAVEVEDGLKGHLNEYNKWAIDKRRNRKRVYASRCMQGLNSSRGAIKRAIKSGCMGVSKTKRKKRISGFIMTPKPIKKLPVSDAFKFNKKIKLPKGLQMDKGKNTVITLGSQGKSKDIVQLINDSMSAQTVTVLAARGYEETVQEIKGKYRVNGNGRKLDLAELAKDKKSGVQFVLNRKEGGSVIVNILPMIKPELMAVLYKKADLIQAKAGGVSVMELFAISENAIRNGKKVPEVEFKTGGCPKWEKLNAEAYMRAHKSKKNSGKCKPVQR